ncbi:MAG TPA: hydroxymethylglutaryl-CoA lyase [Acidimicrobiales bacterium]|nr:hydroxymethylglutaryl-CoA lyase [Acidimicrobiales bacterium]
MTALDVASVRIREVGPRDGLQAEAPVPVEGRVQLIEALASAGLADIEAVAFVSPKAVPSMADADKVLDLLPRTGGIRYIALVPNLFGAQRAVAAQVDGMSVTVSASPAYNARNVHMSVEESVAAVAEICALPARGTVDAVVSCAFGSPYEGDIAPAEVAALGERLRAAGVDSLTYADTTGMATPRRIDELVAETGADIGLHLHETRGTGLVNAYAALQLGVTRFDTSVGGLGGSPFAAGAAGNLATEDLVHLLDDLGVDTGVDLDRLLEASAFVAELVGHPVPSRVAAAGPRSRLAAN